MPGLPHAILFDLDDTVITAYANPRGAWLTVTTELAAHLHPLTPSQVTDAVAAYSITYWGDDERHRWGRMNLLAARRAIVAEAFANLARAGLQLPAGNVGERLADRFSAYRDEQMRLAADAHAVIDALRARGVRLALVTNGPAIEQRAKVTRFQLAHRFDHIQIEGEHAFGKPDPRAYRHALDALSVAAADAWMVGDNLEWEVAAPQRLGIHAIWFDPAGQGLPAGCAIRPDRIIRSLSELIA